MKYAGKGDRVILWEDPEHPSNDWEPLGPGTVTGFAPDQSMDFIGLIVKFDCGVTQAVDLDDLKVVPA